MISFLDVLLIKREDSMDLAVFRKETNTDLSLNWDAFRLKLEKQALFEPWQRGHTKYAHRIIS